MKSASFFSPTTLVAVLLFAGFAAVPFVAAVIDEPFWTSFFARILIYAVAASALNLALGYGGLVSFGHALFLGLGVYAVALPSHYGVANGFAHLGLALLACGLVALAVGIVSLRTSGMAFIMITLAFAQMGYFLFVSLKQYGGDDGLAIMSTSAFGPFDLGGVTKVYVAAWLVLLALTLWMAKLRASPFGMALRGSRQNPRRVNAMGLQTRQVQLVAFVLSGTVCGVAGLLLANLNAFASPSSMAWTVSGELIVMVVLGGMGTVLGPVVGALLYLGLEEILKAWTEHWMAVFGPLIVLFTLMGKRGIVGLIEAALDARRHKAQVASSAVATEGQ
jgi:branched-chain amino acid transport system permease protein